MLSFLRFMYVYAFCLWMLCVGIIVVDNRTIETGYIHTELQTSHILNLITVTFNIVTFVGVIYATFVCRSISYDTFLQITFFQFHLISTSQSLHK